MRRLAHAEHEPRDLFLVYAPEDRLPIAAPPAIELPKRRVSVAFADFEVTTSARLTGAIASGLAHHRGGVVLSTRRFEWAPWHRPISSDRIRVLRHHESRIRCPNCGVGESTEAGVSQNNPKLRSPAVRNLDNSIQKSPAA